MSDCALEKHDTSNGCSDVTSSVTSHACGDNKAAEKNATIEDAPLLNGGSPQKRKNGLIAKSASPGSEDAKPNSQEASPINNSDNLLQPKEEAEDCATPNNHNHSGLNGSADTKGFDDSCFKTPTLPVRKASIGRKRPSGLTRPNGLPETHPSSDGVAEKDSITTGLRSVKLESEPSCSKTPCSCPFSKEYLSACFPNLPEKSLRERNADFVQELIIDGHSLLMFKATDDLKVLSEKEKDRKDAEAREAKRKQYYEDLRVGKVKKKGRKSKKEVEGNGDQEDPEDRRRRKEERRRERMERKARGEKADETPEEKERRREEKRRLKRERKTAVECRTDVARSSGTGMQASKALQNGHDASSSSAAAMLVALSNGDHGTSSSAPVENNENQPTLLGSPAVVGIKRPGSVLGGSGSPAIAPSPKLQRISSAHSLDRTSKPSTPKSEPSASVPFGMSIGIQRPNVPSLPSAYGQDQRAGSASEHAAAASNPLASFANNYARNTSVIDKAGKQMQNGVTNPTLMDFNAMFSNNPAFAANLRNAMATLQSVDPSLVYQTQLLNAAAINARPFPPFDSQLQAVSANGSGVNGANAIGASPGIQPKLSVAGSSSATASASNPMELQFPAGAALAAKLAGAAMFGKEPPGSSATAPAKKSRWCDMHVTLAHSIARHRSSASSRGPSAVASSQAQPLSSQNAGLTQGQSWAAAGGLTFGLPGPSTSRQSLPVDDGRRMSSPTKKMSIATSNSGVPMASLNTLATSSSQQSLNALQQTLYAHAQLASSSAAQLPLTNQLFGALSQLSAAHTAPSNTSTVMSGRAAQGGITSGLPLQQSSSQRTSVLDHASLMAGANQAHNATIQSAAAAALHPALGLFGGNAQVSSLAAQLANANPLLACAGGGSLTNGISGSALQAQQQQQQMLMLLAQLQGASGQASTSNPLAGINASQLFSQQVPTSSVATNPHLPAANPHFPAANTAPLTLNGVDFRNDNAIASILQHQLQTHQGSAANRQMAADASALELFRHQYEASNSPLFNRTGTNASVPSSTAGTQSGYGAALEHEMQARLRQQLFASQLTAAAANPASQRAPDPYANMANNLGGMDALLQQHMLARAGFPQAAQASSAANAAALFNGQAAAHMMSMNALASNPLAAAHLYGTNSAKLPLSSSAPKRDGTDSFLNGR